MFADPNPNRSLADVQRMGMLGGQRAVPFPRPMSRLEMLAAGTQGSGALPMAGAAFAGTMPQGFASSSVQPQAASLDGMFANQGKSRPPLGIGGAANGMPAPMPSDPSVPPNLLTQDASLPAPRTDIMTQMPDISNVPTRHPKFFEHHGLGEKLLGGLSEFALQYSAGLGNPAAMAMIQNRSMQQRQQQAWNHEDATHRQDHQWEVDAAAAKARLPEYFMSGRDRVAFDPTSGTSKVVYDGPTDAHDYAEGLGLKPGTPEYNSAMTDFVLKGNGSTAFQNKTNLEGVRQDDRESLENLRQGNRQTLRATPTYANLHPHLSGAGNGGGGSGPPKTFAGVVAPIMAKVARGQALSPSEQSVYDNYNSRGRGGRAGARPASAPASASGGIPEGTMIRNPTTGHTMKRQGGAWVDMK